MRRAVIAAVGLAAVLTAWSCGPSKVRPKEAELSGLPEPVVAAFRRGQPNSIITGFREVSEGYRVDYLTPLRKKEWAVYNASGDRLRDSE
jgi:hypothetical protein